MAAAHTLSLAEVRIIKAMLALRPRPSNQAILSYFTRPQRDINHRVIAEIASGQSWPREVPASMFEVLTYMAATEKMDRPLADEFVTDVEGEYSDGPDRRTHPLILDWWPVGQGLFSSGAIVRRKAPPLTWVYDCGTTSSDAILDDALKAYGAQQRSIGSDAIHLAVLSHFDNDHISGFVRLITNFRIRTLLLPYVPLWQRLIIAIEEGVAVEDANSASFSIQWRSYWQSTEARSARLSWCHQPVLMMLGRARPTSQALDPRISPVTL